MSRIGHAVRDWLVSQPETGMGYQLVEAVLGRDTSGPLLVVNAASWEPISTTGVLREGLSKAANSRVEAWMAEPPANRDFRLRLIPVGEARPLLKATAYRAESGPASEAVPKESEPDERFLRFSAFADDIRILPDGSVRAGTYVTTFADGIAYVHTGMNAVRRYALPNPAPASHRFHLRPPDPIRVRRGTVQPANGQPGGGAEVIFDEQAGAGTCYKKDTLPDGV